MIGRIAINRIGCPLSATLQRVFTLQSVIHVVSSSQSVIDTVIIDSTLGRSTVFLFDFVSNSIAPSITSPSGVTYDATSSFVIFDSRLKSYTFTIPDADFEVGTWTYSITTTSTDDVTVAVTVTSMAGEAQTATFVVNCFWTTSTVTSLSPELASVPMIVATVALGM